MAYKFKKWFFQWRSDEGGHLTLVIAGCVGLTKYKHSTVVRWLPRLPPAGKYQGDYYPTTPESTP